MVQLLSPEDQARFMNGYESHLKAPYYVSVQRRGRQIHLARTDSKEVEIFIFELELNAQRCLSALTDCFRVNRTPIKVLMPGFGDESSG